jgi:hypothetical protein
VIDPGELWAILAKMAREIEPIYDPEPKIQDALVSIAQVVNQEWVKAHEEFSARVLKAADNFDAKLRTALDTLSAADAARIKALITGV